MPTAVAVFALAINLTVCAQSTQLVLQTPRVRSDDHRSVFLHWNAETGAVYQVESADALDADGPQGLKWLIRDSDCISKGTNAEWMDVGDSRWVPRVLHPVFQTQRFYRVQKVNQATNTPPVLSVQLSQTNGITGNFIVSVSVSVADTNQSLNSVSLFVDGQRLGSIPSFPSTNFGVWINSTEWPNGPHEIYANATIADSAETTPENDAQADPTNATVYAVGVSPSQLVTFSNYISQFFVATPYFQAGQTQEVVAQFEQDSYWRVTVVNYQDTEVRRFEGQGTSCYAAWDGNDQFGSPLPYGFYDYIIDARPSEYGSLSLVTSPSGAARMSAVISAAGTNDTDPAAVYRRTAPAMQFSRTNCDIVENIQIPSLNPQPPATTSTNSDPNPPFPSSPQEALVNGRTSYFIQPPPMPPVRTNISGVWTSVPWADVYGPQPPIEVQIPLRTQEKFLQSLNDSLNGRTPLPDDPQPQDWPDATYETRTPTRIPGAIFFGFAGTVGVAYQGHHPSSPPFGYPPGGALASPPPWGKIASASTLATGFSTDMGLAGWRTSFLKGNDNFNSLDLAPVLGPGTGTGTFATKCNFGLVVGHMATSAYEDPNYYATVSYVPIYNSSQPGGYQWIALPGMDFGNGGVYSKLRWIAFYGCNVLNERDYIDQWTKFLVPMPPNLRLILGSEEGIFVDPRFGPLFADNMNGWTTQNGQPMSIFNAWCDAASFAFAMENKKFKHRLPLWGLGTRHSTAIYRDTTQGGSWDTLSDSIWSWGTDVSYDWFDVSFYSQQVFP